MDRREKRRNPTEKPKKTGGNRKTLRPGLDSRIHLKFYYAKRRFPVTSKCRQMHGVLNVDKIIN
jgi:hypothetical protein